MDRGWGDLPAELLIMVMSYMNAKELARAGTVNYHWNRVGEDDSLWRPLLLRDYKLPKTTKLKGYGRWIDEYKMMKFEAPTVLCEDLRDCPRGLTSVCFSHDGLLFCTTGNDGSFKIWTATTPSYLVHERRLRDTLDWDRTLFAQFSPDCNGLLVCGVKSDGHGEVATFSVDSEECEVHFLCRAPNRPSDFSSCWYNNSHILTGDLYFFDRKLLNRHGGFSQLLTLGRYIPPRLRGVVLLAEEATVENKSLAAKAQELAFGAREGATEEERRTELRRRIEELSASVECSCSGCISNHDGKDSGPDAVLCCCGCHDDDDRLLIHAYGDTNTLPPHAVAFKIVNGQKVVRLLHQRCSRGRSEEEARNSERRRAQGDPDDQLSSILALFDLPDYVIEMRAYVMGFTLSPNHRYLLVNVTHDQYGGDETFNNLAETRVINLETLSFEGSYFGHFATMLDRFQCSVGGHYLTSPSTDGGRVWSKEHRCVVGRLSHQDAAAIAIEPLTGEMLVSVGRTDGRIKIWRCKKYFQKLSVPNDFM